MENDVYGGQGPNPSASDAPWGLNRIDVFDDTKGSFEVRQPYEGSLHLLSISYYANDGSEWIHLDFATDTIGVPLAPGVYTGAQRFLFNAAGHPGLDYSRTGGGFNTLDGQFRIYEIQRGPDQQVTSFAASWEIYNYPAPPGSPLTGGRIWINSDVSMGPTAPVPEPSTWALSAFGLAAVVWSTRRRKQA